MQVGDRLRTGLDGYLKARGFSRLFFCGLALDYCVAWSAIDARQADVVGQNKNDIRSRWFGGGGGVCTQAPT